MTRRLVCIFDLANRWRGRLIQTRALSARFETEYPFGTTLPLLLIIQFVDTWRLLVRQDLIRLSQIHTENIDGVIVTFALDIDDLGRARHRG